MTACCCLYGRHGLSSEPSLVVASQWVACKGKQGGWSADSIYLIPAQHTGHLVIVSVWHIQNEMQDGIDMPGNIYQHRNSLHFALTHSPMLALDEGSHQTELSSLHHCTENLSSPAKLCPSKVDCPKSKRTPAWALPGSLQDPAWPQLLWGTIRLKTISEPMHFT